MKFAIDCMGSDYPEAIVKGCIDAINIYNDVELVLFGKEQFITNELKKYQFNQNQLTIIDAKDVITNDESPTVAIKKKTDSSMVKALHYLKETDDCEALISCGSTGAFLVGGIFTIGRLPGVARPALIAVLQSLDGKEICLLDCGANVDCRSEYLVQFAILGAKYYQALGNKEEPRVALLANGTEDKKGNELTKETFQKLQNTSLNFVGNMEARDLLSGKYDVVVCDGFNGNILMKGLEGAAMHTLKVMYHLLEKNKPAEVDGTFLKQSLMQAIKKLDYNSEGGGCLLGLNKLLLKGHGAANEKTIAAVIKLAKRLVEQKCIEQCAKGIQEEVNNGQV